MATRSASDASLTSSEDVETVHGFLLPAELLRKMLQYVDQKHRIGMCAQVCRAWRIAARAATTSIFMGGNSPDIGCWKQNGNYGASLTEWLLGDVTCLTSLRARGNCWWMASHPRLQLPFYNLKQLRSLNLEWFTVESCGAASSLLRLPSMAPPLVGSAESATDNINNNTMVATNHLCDLGNLTSLELDRVTINLDNGLQRLFHLTNLRRLHLCYVEPEDQASAIINAALACMTQLTHLTIELNDKEDTQLGVVGPFVQSNLKELDLSNVGLSLGAAWTIPKSVSSLRFESVQVPSRMQDPSQEYLPQSLKSELAELPWSWSLAILPSLRRLVLEHMFVDGLIIILGQPVVTMKLVNLQYLSLENSSCHHAETTSYLLAALQYLTNLQHLNLRSTLCHVVQPVAAYSTLTSSSKLTYLDLRSCELPFGVITAMFPLLRRLPELHVLIFSKVDCHTKLREDQNNDLGASGVESMVLCCPGLQELHICGALQKGEQLTTLGTLQQLRTLTIGGPNVDDAIVAASVPYLTNVAYLGIAKSPSFTTHGLVILTQLTQLTQLQVVDCGVCDVLKSRVGRIESKVDPPDVWKQLEQKCIKNNVGRELLLVQGLVQGL